MSQPVLVISFLAIDFEVVEYSNGFIFPRWHRSCPQKGQKQLDYATASEHGIRRCEARSGAVGTVLPTMRNIHIKEEIPKLFGQIVLSVAKDNLISNMSKFQLATKPGHRATEHLFTVMSIMENCESENNAII